MSKYSRKIAVGVVGAVLIAATLGLVASTSFPSGTPAYTVTVASSTTLTPTSVATVTPPGPTSSQTTSAGVTTTQTTTSEVTSTTLSTTTSVTCNNPCSPTITTNPTASVGIDYGQIANATMYSPAVQAYVNTAYSYDIVGISPDSNNPNIASVILNVTGTQTVTGNWTTGYTVSYSGNRMLNVTVQLTPPSTYEVTNVGLTTLVDHSGSVAFSPEQQQVIQVALSGSTVEQLTGQSPYYVESVTPFPVTNGTYAGDYFTLLYQLNGTRIVGVFVNTSGTTVVDAYADTRTTMMCFGSSPPGICFTSPWEATG